MRTHGKVATYNAGCRCADCREAAGAARRRSPSRIGRSRLYPSGRPTPRDDYRWMDRAACTDTDPSVFFPRTASYGPAKALCAGCDVQLDCLRYAIATDQPDGVWGGLSFDERQRRTSA